MNYIFIIRHDLTYFWTGEYKLFHHTSFKIFSLKNLTVPFLAEKILIIYLLILLSDHFLPEYRAVKITLTAGNADTGFLYFSIPSVTQEGTFLLNGKERAFILNLVESPGLIFNEDEAIIRPCPFGQVIRFFRHIPCRDIFKDENLINKGCVELKGKCFITPLFLFLAGVLTKR
jgi:hypothetical protein